MAFNIYSRGTSNFIYRSENCPDDDIFTLGDMALSSRGQDNDRSALVLQGIRTYARSQAAHLLTTGIDLILMHTRRNQGNISFILRSESILWVDDTLFLEMNLANINSSDEFQRKLLRELRKMEMNNFGVILEIGKALNMFEANLNSRTTPMLMIYLTN